MVDLYCSCINVDKALGHLLVILILSHICNWLLMCNLQLEALVAAIKNPLVYLIGHLPGIYHLEHYPNKMNANNRD
jgi:hypothetical protein